MVTKKKSTTQGTYEEGWAGPQGVTLNISKGCEDACHYCYARCLAARRKQIAWEDWAITSINWKIVNKGYRKKRVRVMFPSTHNINSFNIEPSITFLKNLIPHVKSLLIVVKPHFDVVKRICREFEEHNDKIELRYTITTYDDWIRRKYEPNSSTVIQRLSSINIGKKYGFLVSVSIEPFLDADPLILIKKLWARKVSPEQVWLGPMNHRKELAKRSKVIFDSSHYLEAIYSPLSLKAIKNQLKLSGFNVHFKDGFVHQMNAKVSKQ